MVKKLTETQNLVYRMMVLSRASNLDFELVWAVFESLLAGDPDGPDKLRKAIQEAYKALDLNWSAD